MFFYTLFLYMILYMIFYLIKLIKLTLIHFCPRWKTSFHVDPSPTQLHQPRRLQTPASPATTDKHYRPNLPQHQGMRLLDEFDEDRNKLEPKIQRWPSRRLEGAILGLFQPETSVWQLLLHKGSKSRSLVEV